LIGGKSPNSIPNEREMKKKKSAREEKKMIKKKGQAQNWETQKVSSIGTPRGGLLKM